MALFVDNIFSQSPKAHSSAQRFKVTSKLRCLHSDVTTDTEEGERRGATVSAGERVHMCDVMQEDGEENR